MDIFKFVNLIEKEEEFLTKKNKTVYTEDELDHINKLVHAGKKIKDPKLLEIFYKLKEAGLF
jgi:hypothetical protein